MLIVFYQVFLFILNLLIMIYPIDYLSEIKRLKTEKNAIILAHYYETSDIQDIADYIGDSLALSQKAAKNSADIILFAGVKFMAETAKLLAPEKKVLVPDIEAGCSLADSCNAIEFKKFIDNYPDHIVITYVNTTAEIKALSDITCTSSNAVKIVESLPLNQKIIFAPDRNLGNYIMKKTGRKMVLWDGACHVHDSLSPENINKMKQDYPDAKVLVHPECKSSIIELADFTGSTSAILQYAQNTDCNTFIVVTEQGIIHQMKKNNPNKNYIPLIDTCNNLQCKYMKMVTLEKIYNCLKNETPEIFINDSIAKLAVKPIIRMLELS